MGAQPVMFAPNTLGSLFSRIQRKARESLDFDDVAGDVNDAIESLWMSVSLATLSKFVGRPVSQFIPSQVQSFTLVSIPDPTAPLETLAAAGGALPARSYSPVYTYVTDSGSETAASPATAVPLDAGTLFAARPPLLVPDAVGWNLYVDSGQGTRILQNPTPLPFNQNWIEPPLGLRPSPDGVVAPLDNSTGDNIFSISRLDIANQDGTFTTWLDTDISSANFTMYQNRYPLASTFPRHAFDLLGNRNVEFRPAAGTDMDATLFFITRPRRLRFPISRLPFTSFPSEGFLFHQALATTLAGLYEDEAAAVWKAQADADRQQVVLSVLGESWNQNTTVKPYMRY